MSVPVLLISFNRPDLTKLTLKRIIESNPSKIYFAVDGARKQKEGEIEKVEQVRALVNLIPNSIEYETKFSTSNQGCRNGVTSAITWFFSMEEKGIILEDDCLPDLTFFQFCENLLEYYKKDDRIGMISGDNFFTNQISIRESYYFSKYFHIWGWASWRRAWEGYQAENVKLEDVELVLDKKLSNKRAKQIWIRWIMDSSSGIVDTWDHQWTYHNWKNNRISIMPNKNLIKNLGFRSDGTHTLDENSQFSSLPVESMEFPLIHPKSQLINSFYQIFAELNYFPFWFRGTLFRFRLMFFKLSIWFRLN
ncbi:hypothetical protein [Leptospira kanakyensis]|uniref:Nucleotide-diphospho-sugar transferase n=1 Tax=Leptospira kanakyensis TaxID=2484968 RepID=A0A6N4QKD8_9LEPT|nr:hypothetical protein [Leptospira kanakyensis]MCW7482105.1 hypothetical protein [Leptospira kanakyensis]TGK57189.1 hypothetical protein EHQ16_15025 [Leptospira kanakyensis]TGK72899.1 hypothetical protein EHQ18_03400 [Leptospira kanakyensis]